MPDLIRLYIRSVATGFGIAAAFTAGLVWWDVAGLGHLILGSDIGWIAAAMMVVFNGIVFSAVQFAVRIMAMSEDDGGPRGGHGAREPVLVPVPVPVPVPVHMPMTVAVPGRTRNRR
jgi:TRAP-type C4-dicarboxylate transport system permease small subunit